MKARSLDRIIFLLTGLLAAYQVAVGIEAFSTIPIITYTIAFGVLLIASLLLLILGLEVLESPVVAIASTIIPLSMALGLVWQYVIPLRMIYLTFASLGFLVVLLTRILPSHSKLPVLTLALVHGLAGLTIFILPFFLVLQGTVKPTFTLVGIGGGLIGIGGLLLSFLKTGKPILSRQTILKILPAVLFLMMVCYVLGFMFG